MVEMHEQLREGHREGHEKGAVDFIQMRSQKRRIDAQNSWHRDIPNWNTNQKHIEDADSGAHSTRTRVIL